MKYTVVWVKPAENKLMELWRTASDQQALADASDRIDRELKNDPERKVAEWDEGIFVYESEPLLVLLTISPDDRLVEVIDVQLTS